MASRMRVAASACLVASGLFVAGAGGAIALADPGPGYGKSDDRRANDSLGDAIRRALGMDSGNDQKASEPRHRAAQSLGSGQPGRTQCLVRRSRSRRGADRRRPAKPTTPTHADDQSPRRHRVPKPKRCPDPGQPPGGEEPPAPEEHRRRWWWRHRPTSAISSHRTVPDMQLPDELQPGEPAAPGGLAVLDAGAGAVAAAAPDRPAAPIALPVIVAPPIGLGGGAGGAGPAGTPPGPPPARPAP